MSEIVQLKTADESALADINVLLKQLSERIPHCTMELLERLVKSSEVEIWVAKEDGKIVGMGELALILKPEGIIAQIEDVVVDGSQRGKGLGKIISEKLIERARANGARMIALESKPAREAANALYQKLGFVQHETNVYQMKL